MYLKRGQTIEHLVRALSEVGSSSAMVIVRLGSSADPLESAGVFAIWYSGSWMVSFAMRIWYANCEVTARIGAIFVCRQ
jgi:hypothetical protein